MVYTCGIFSALQTIKAWIRSREMSTSLQCCFYHYFGGEIRAIIIWLLIKMFEKTNESPTLPWEHSKSRLTVVQEKPEKYFKLNLLSIIFKKTFHCIKIGSAEKILRHLAKNATLAHHNRCEWREDFSSANRLFADRSEIGKFLSTAFKQH